MKDSDLTEKVFPVEKGVEGNLAIKDIKEGLEKQGLSPKFLATTADGKELFLLLKNHENYCLLKGIMEEGLKLCLSPMISQQQPVGNVKFQGKALDCSTHKVIFLSENRKRAGIIRFYSDGSSEKVSYQPGEPKDLGGGCFVFENQRVHLQSVPFQIG